MEVNLVFFVLWISLRLCKVEIEKFCQNLDEP